MKYKFFFFIYVLSFFSVACCDELTRDPPLPWPVDCRPCDPKICPLPHKLKTIEEQITVNLTDPVYEDGTLCTDKGGVLQTHNLRVQARHIRYVKKLEASPPEFCLYCEGDLMVDYEGKTLVGSCFYYNFIDHSGILIDGRAAFPPWYVGGNQIIFHPSGEFVVYQGYISTSEGPDKEVKIVTPKIRVDENQILTASNIHLRIKEIPIAWFPKIHLDLKTLPDNIPIAVKFGWGGFLGSYLSLRYHFLTWKELYGYLRLDGYSGKGLGVGFETEYEPCFSPTEFYTRNYYAHDLSLDDPTKRDRYRFEGSYSSCWFQDIAVEGFYDFVSDAEMAADYQADDFSLNPAQQTQIEFHKQSQDWIATLFARVRVNKFQSINQELPSLTYSWHPFELGSSGIMIENRTTASFLDYHFSDDIDVIPNDPNQTPNFHAFRFAVDPHIYRPFYLDFFILTPYARFIGIAYSNSQSGSAKGQAIGDFGVTAKTSIYKCFSSFKHVLEPYLDVRYLTHPTVGVDDTYIFSIQDGWNRLSLARFGLKNTFFTKECGCIQRTFFWDLWSQVFINEHFIKPWIQKAYLDIEWNPLSSLQYGIQTAWNFEHHIIDYFNTQIQWTLSYDAAFSLEYRHRSKYDWRKADFYNFILDVSRSESELLTSPVSDQRDAFLASIFYRFSPNLWAKFQFRHGWHRREIKNYTEYQIDLTQVIFDHWHLLFTYEKRNVDQRYSITFKLAPAAPTLY